MQAETHFWWRTNWLSQFWRLFLLTWPLWAVMLINGSVIYNLTQTGQITIDLPSILIAGIILLVGLLPLIFRPSQFTTIFGCFAIALATVVVLITSNSQLWLFKLVGPPNLLMLGSGTLQLVNSALLGPLALHLAIVRAPRALIPPAAMLSIYVVTGMAFCGVLLTEPGVLRTIAHILLLISFLGTIAVTAWLLIRTSQNAFDPDRLGPEARLVLVSLLLAELPLLLAPWLSLAGLWLPLEVIIGSQVLLPLGVAVSVLRPDLLRIDPTVRRALTYSALSLLVLAIYLGMTSMLTFVLSWVDQPLRGLAMLGGLLAAAIAFTPVRLHTEQVIERMFYPERCSFQHEIARAQQAMAQVVRRESVVTLLTDDLPRQLGARWGQLILHDAPAELAPDQQPAWSSPLQVGEQVLGYYRLGKRITGLPYTPVEQSQLTNLVQQAALALAYAETVDALRLLNSELEERVAARTEQVLAQQRELIAIEERQRLARDLHDSVKQTLFSLGLGLRAVRGLMQSDQQRAMVVLHEQEQTVVQAQTEMGTLLASLRDLPHQSVDLRQLLASHCADLTHRHQLQIAIEGPATLYLPEQLANELLLVAREALYNVVKHSRVQTAQLQLTLHNNTIGLMICDQGQGFAPDAAPEGLGLRGIAERMVALDGTFELHSAPGAGTRVMVRVPYSG